MQQALLLLPVVIPALFWAAYHYHKDRHLPEPCANLVLCFGLGLLAAGTSAFLYEGLEPLGLRYDAVELGNTNPLGLLAFAVFAIGPIEEFAKLLPFVLIVIHFKAFDEPLDGIVYASFIALGYAAAENVHYLDYLTTVESVARGFAGPAVHILFASIWAYWITTARLARKPWAWAAVAGFLIASTLHGIYDFLVLQSPVAALPIGAALILAIWIWRLRLLKKMHDNAVRGH